MEEKKRPRQWEDQNGNKRYSTEIYADVMQMLGRRADSGQENGAAPTTQAAATHEPHPFEAPTDNDPADDLPF